MSNFRIDYTPIRDKYMSMKTERGVQADMIRATGMPRKNFYFLDHAPEKIGAKNLVELAGHLGVKQLNILPSD